MKLNLIVGLLDSQYKRTRTAADAPALKTQFSVSVLSSINSSGLWTSRRRAPDNERPATVRVRSVYTVQGRQALVKSFILECVETADSKESGK